MEPLHPIEVRVLGSLLEKDLTTPEYYPLTLNALQNACNQKSSREPVVNYDETTVAQGLELLRQKQLVLKVSGAGHRVEKYAHRLGETLNLGRRELAILCVLMLRGPQTVGELRGRTERMHPFEDMEEVERVLEGLAARQPDPLAAPATRGRWRHLWSGGAAAEAEEEAESSAARAHFEPQAPLEGRVAALEREVDELKRQMESFRRQFE
ncbi:MAG: YceH family protein [Acidobacteriia bacterium]|nr:YceH family protein [Terriglobia bacterium]